MDFLNQAYGQLADLFRSMTPAARITAGLLLAVVVISLVYLVGFQTTGSDEYLFGGREFSDRELDTMEAAFSTALLSGWDRRENRLRVPRGQKAEYMAALVNGNALPASFGSYFSKLMADKSPFVNRQQREMELVLAKREELRLIIERMPGVEAASVQYDEEDKGGLHRTKDKIAVVAVQLEGNTELDQKRVQSIRKLVGGAFAGLKDGNIRVTDINGMFTYTETNIDGLPGGGDNPFLETQAEYEAHYRNKIYDLLKPYPGAVVAVNVKLDPKLRHETTETTYGAQPRTLASSGFTKESESSSPAPGGRVGAAPNGVGNTGAAVSNTSLSMSESTATETSEEQRNLWDQTTVTSREASLVPQLVTASISIPSSHYVKVWRERNPTPAGQEPQPPDPTELRNIEQEVIGKIEKDVVQVLIRPDQGDDPYPLVTVNTYTPLTPDPPEKPNLAKTAFTWLSGNWQTLAMTVVGLFSLVMLRGMIRSVRSAPPPEEGIAAPRLALIEEEQPPTASQSPLKRRGRPTGPTLREELTDMVREDPNAAANVLRNWIGDAA